MKIFKAIVYGALTFALGACVPAGYQDETQVASYQSFRSILKVHTVKLVVTGKGGNRKLLILAGPGNCNVSTSVGCVKVPKGEQAAVTFELFGIPDWKFTRMQLVAGPNKIGFANQADFTAEMRADFYVVDQDGNDRHPDANGIIDLTDVGNADGTGFTLNDLNQLAHTYRYQIEACKGGSCENSDPRFVNEGDD